MKYSNVCEAAHRSTSSFGSPPSRCLCLCSSPLLSDRTFEHTKKRQRWERFSYWTWVTCDHDLQLSQGGVRGVSQEDVNISHHAGLLIHTGVGPLLLVQDDECALCGNNSILTAADLEMFGYQVYSALSWSSLQLLCMSYSCSRVSGSEAVSCCSSGDFIHSWYLPETGHKHQPLCAC